MHTRMVFPAICLCAIQVAVCDEFVLVKDGKSAYHIVVAVDATMHDYHAAQLLQRYVQEMTGAELAIVSDDNALGDAEIIVGFNRHVELLAPDLKRQDFGPEEFLVKTFDNRLVIVGGTPRGVLYGVNSVLIEEWGCRWFTPRLRRIPKHQQLTLESVERRYQPPFAWRNVEYEAARDVEWTFHNFVHQEVHRSDQAGWPEKGWRRTGPAQRCFVHTMPGLLPPSRYRQDHPDWFWPRDDGPPRSGPAGQGRRIGACVTHPDVARAVAEALLELRRNSPEGDVWYILASGDYNDWCECARCQKWLRKEMGGTLPPPHPQWGAGASWPYGAMWLDFARRVDEILSAHPDPPKVGMLAYGDTPVPPARPVMHERLCVMYAQHGCDQFHPLADPEQSVPRRLEGWLKSAGTVYMWLYTMNYGRWCFIHPTDALIAGDMRYLRRMGVKGVFAEGNAAVSGLYAGDMSELHSYLFARLMWNPDLDWRELRHEFCAAYYGQEAGKVIEGYLDDRYAELVKSGQRGSVGMGKEYFEWITPQIFERWYGHLSRAEALAADEEHKKNVRVARLAVQFTEANLVKDPIKRKEALQAYVDATRKLVGNPAMNLGEHHHTWAARQGLRW